VAVFLSRTIGFSLWIKLNAWSLFFKTVTCKTLHSIEKNDSIKNTL
jgi:hypothetical protein